jgi:hypothetical protein
MTNRMAATCLCAVLLGGCSSANVVKNPTDDDNGIRYYRPKPYLMVTPADATGRMVKLEILYLPDYCEEYSIHPKGKKPPAVQLKDGWNLVGVGGPPAPPEPPPAAAPPAGAPMKLPEAVLVAGNVPIGLYESVFDRAGPGKYLKGWRYVGFSPLGGGGPPNGTDAAATAAAAKGCPACTVAGGGSVSPGPLFGLVFFNGAMTFRQLDEIANNMTCPEYRKPMPPEPVAAPPIGGTQVLPTNPKPAGGSGNEVIPITPKAPSANPGAFHDARPRPYQIDAGVAQTTSRMYSPPVRYAPPTTISPPVPKGPDPKALAALEADVFKKLNLSVPAASQSAAPAYSSYSLGAGSTKASMPPKATAPVNSSTVPDLSPAMPLN